MDLFPRVISPSACASRWCGLLECVGWHCSLWFQLLGMMVLALGLVLEV